MKNIEEIPVAILDLLDQKPFRVLSDQEKVLVLKYLGQGEYDAMHAGSMRLQDFAHAQKGRSVRKAALMDRFDAQHPQKKPATSLNLPLWGKAALLLLALGLGMLISPLPRKNTGIVHTVIKRDTLWLKEEVYPKVVVEDRGSAPAAVVQTTKPLKGVQKNTQQLPGAVEALPGNREHILALTEFQNVENQVHRGGVRSDPLPELFPPARL